MIKKYVILNLNTMDNKTLINMKDSEAINNENIHNEYAFSYLALCEIDLINHKYEYYQNISNIFTSVYKSIPVYIKKITAVALMDKMKKIKIMSLENNVNEKTKDFVSKITNFYAILNKIVFIPDVSINRFYFESEEENSEETFKNIAVKNIQFDSTSNTYFSNYIAITSYEFDKKLVVKNATTISSMKNKIDQLLYYDKKLKVIPLNFNVKENTFYKYVRENVYKISSVGLLSLYFSYDKKGLANISDFENIIEKYLEGNEIDAVLINSNRVSYPITWVRLFIPVNLDFYAGGCEDNFSKELFDIILDPTTTILDVNFDTCYQNYYDSKGEKIFSDCIAPEDRIEIRDLETHDKLSYKEFIKNFLEVNE